MPTTPQSTFQSEIHLHKLKIPGLKGIVISFEKILEVLPNIFTLPPGFLSSTNSPAFIGSPVSVSISTTRQGCKSKASAARTRKASVVSPVPRGKWSIEIQLRVGGLGWWFLFKRFPKKSIWPYFSETTSTSTGPERRCTSKGHYITAFPRRDSISLGPAQPQKKRQHQQQQQQQKKNVPSKWSFENRKHQLFAWQ